VYPDAAEWLWVEIPDGPWRHFDADNKKDTILTLFTDAADPSRINPALVQQFADAMRPKVDAYVGDWAERDDSVKLEGVSVLNLKEWMTSPTSKVRKDFARYLRRRAPKLAKVLEYLEADFQLAVVAQAMSAYTQNRIAPDEPVTTRTHPLINLYADVKADGVRRTGTAPLDSTLLPYVDEWHNRSDSLKLPNPEDFIDRPESGPRKDFTLYLAKRAPALLRRLRADTGAVDYVAQAMRRFYGG
jgi:hypothetical protein